MIEILRPNAPGDVTQLGIGGTAPAPTNWQSVNEVVSNEDVAYVGGTSHTSYDLYSLPVHTGNGPINFIKVYARCKAEMGYMGARIKIKTNAIEYDGVSIGDTFSWADYSHQWNTNPATGLAWTWDEIDALQTGVSLGFDIRIGRGLCTQVYVEVDSTPEEVVPPVGCLPVVAGGILLIAGIIAGIIHLL